LLRCSVWRGKKDAEEGRNCTLIARRLQTFFENGGLRINSAASENNRMKRENSMGGPRPNPRLANAGNTSHRGEDEKKRTIRNLEKRKKQKKRCEIS